MTAEGTAPARSRRRRRLRLPRLSLTARLLALALVPLILASIMSANSVSQRQSSARAAGRAVAHAKALAGVTKANNAVTHEVLDAFVNSATSGLTAGKTTGLSLTPADVSASDAILASLPVGDPLIRKYRAIVLPQLAAARKAVTTRGSNPLTVFGGYMTVVDTGATTIDAESLAVEQESGAVPGGQQLFIEMEGLRSMARLLQQGTALGTDLLGMLAGGASGIDAKGRLEVDLRQLETSQAAFDKTAPADLLASWKLIGEQPNKEMISSIRELVAAKGQANAKAALILVVAKSPQNIAGLTSVLAAGIRQVTSSASAAQKSAQRAAKLAAGLSVGLGLLSLLLVLLVSRSIRRPMRRLADRALLISDGELVIGDERGVAEIGVVADALNEAIQTLGRIEEQAGALGRGEFTHPSLQATLPGRLGESLSSSVQQVARLQAHLQQEASHDALTGLVNRRSGIRMIEAALTRAASLQERISVTFIDLDDFKETNDRYGHQIGDAILIACAERLSSLMTERDRLCRFNGDEFVVVSAPARSPADTGMFGRALLACVAEPLTVEGLTVRAEGSAGITFSAADETSAELLARTDKAVRSAKETGRNRVEIFDERMRRELDEQNAMDAALRVAVVEDQFELHYQPVVDTRTGKLLSLEALLRWEMPGKGRIGPDRFIQVAEESDLILDIDRWVLDHVCRQLAEWASNPVMRDVDVALNISGRHLGRGRLVPDVERALALHGAEPSRLIIEITETALVRNETEVATELERLRQRAIRIALDDFGTGYTSIRQLGEMPIDTVKIDRSFMLDTSELADDGGLVGLMCGVAHKMGLNVVAEGVEDNQQLRYLQALGCDKTQGYLVSKPLPVGQLVPWAGAHQESLARAAAAAAAARPVEPGRPNLQAVSNL